MEAWMIYLLKANSLLVIFLLFYTLLFKRLTFYKVNRFYFLTALAVSFAQPAVDWAHLFASGVVPEPAIITQIDWSLLQQPERETLSYWTVIGWLVAGSSILLIIWFLLRLFGIFLIHKASWPTRHPIQSFRSVSNEVNPFSFWQSVYVNPKLHSDAELSGILLHEQIHIREWHTIDVLIMEITLIFCWFNPAAWLLRHSLKENLEYLADRKVIAGGINKKAYQHSLVNLLVRPNPNQTLANNYFTLKSLKNRIVMMNKKRSSKILIGKYLLALPVIALITFMVSYSVAREENAILSLTDIATHVNQTDSLIEEASSEVLPEAKLDTIPKATTEPSPKVKVSRSVKLSGITGTDKEPLYVIDGLESKKALDNLDPNNIESIHVLKDSSATALYGLKGVNGAVLITTKMNGASVKSIDSLSGKIAGIRMVKKDVLENKAAPSNGSVTIRGFGRTDAKQPKVSVRTFTPSGEKNSKLEIKGLGSMNEDEIDVFINEKKATAVELRNLDPNIIREMSVVKDTLSGKGQISIQTKEND